MEQERQGAVDMTRGSEFRCLVEFTLPLILGNVFQLAYGMADAMVVGHFGGKEALAAVGASDPVVNLLILGVSGVCIGASVLMSHFFGAGQMDMLKKQMKVTLVAGMSLALLVMVLGFGTAQRLLRFMKTPEEIIGEGAGYLRIIFLGMPFTCLYNIYAAALRSVGNARAPIRYLMISSLLNIGLDILFVGFGKMGVRGAGLATVCAEGISVGLCILYVRRKARLLCCDWMGGGLDRDLLKKTFSYGGLTALQQCSQPLGNLCIQSLVNTLGVTTVAAFNGVRKIEDIGLVSGRSISSAITTFTAQNTGAGKAERTERGFGKGIVLEMISGILVCLLLWCFRAPLMNLFGRDEGMQEAGAAYFAVMAFAYWLPGLTNGHQGYYRGVGAMRTVLAGTISQILVRTGASFVLIPRMGLQGVGYACILGWLVQLAWQTPYRIYLAGKKNKKST